MRNVFEITESILSSDSDNLCELAKIAGYDPRDLYRDADLSGVDLRDQDISFLVGLNANYRNAVLSPDQRQYLSEHDAVWVPPERRNMWSVISALRLEIIESYLSELVDSADFDAMHSICDGLLEPLRKARNKNPASFSEDEYICEFVSQSARHFLALRELDGQKRLFGALTKARFRFRESVSTELQETMPLSFHARHFLSVFQIDNCTIGFLTSALDYVERREPNNFFRLVSDIIKHYDEIPDRLAAYALNKRPPHKLVVSILMRMTDNSLVKEKVSLSNLLASQTTDAKTLDAYCSALSDAPAIRAAYLGTTMKSADSKVAVAALKQRLHQPRPLGSIELSDVAYHLSDLDSRVRYARQTEHVLSIHQHRILVTEIEKIAKTREEKERVRRVWPKHFK